MYCSKTIGVKLLNGRKKGFCTHPTWTALLIHLTSHPAARHDTILAQFLPKIFEVAKDLNVLRSRATNPVHRPPSARPAPSHRTANPHEVLESLAIERNTSAASHIRSKDFKKLWDVVLGRSSSKARILALRDPSDSSQAIVRDASILKSLVLNYLSHLFSPHSLRNTASILFQTFLGPPPSESNDHSCTCVQPTGDLISGRLADGIHFNGLGLKRFADGSLYLGNLERSPLINSPVTSAQATSILGRRRP